MEICSKVDQWRLFYISTQPGNEYNSCSSFRQYWGPKKPTGLRRRLIRSWHFTTLNWCELDPAVNHCQPAEKTQKNLRQDSFVYKGPILAFAPCRWSYVKSYFHNRCSDSERPFGGAVLHLRTADLTVETYFLNPAAKKATPWIDQCHLIAVCSDETPEQLRITISKSDLSFCSHRLIISNY